MVSNFKAGSLLKGLVGHWSLSKEDTTTGTTNKVTNGTFTTDTGWTKGTGWTISGGTLNKASGTNTATYQTMPTVLGEKYTITYTISNYVAGSVRLELGSTYDAFKSANGTYTITLVSLGNGYIYFRSDTDFVGSIDNVTVYDVAGNVVDKTPNSNNGTRVGTTWTTDRKGQANKAIEITAAGQHIIADNEISGNVDFTIAAWLYDNSTGQDNYAGLILGTGGVIRQSAYIGNTTSITMGFYGVNYPTGISAYQTWRHAVMTYDSSVGTYGTFYAYVDGEYYGLQALTAAPNITGNVNIGEFASGLAYTFIGKISDARVYDRVLTSTEVKSLYNSYNPSLNAGSLQKNLAGYWSLSKSDTTTGTTNKVTNGTFDSDTGWDKGPGWTISGGTANCDGTQGATSNFIQNSVVTIGATYKITFTVSNYVTGGIRPIIGGGLGTTVSANGTYTQTITATTANTVNMAANSIFNGSIDNVTVYDVTGKVVDKTPNSNNGTRVGTTWTTDRKGQANKALSFNGASNSVTIPYSADLEFAGDFTISTWFKTSGYVNQGSVYNAIIAKGQLTVSDSYYYGIYLYNDNRLRFSIIDDNNIIASNTINDSEWHHAVGVRSGGTMYLYLDVILMGTDSVSGTIVSGSDSFYIGRDSSVNRFFNGSISDTLLYNRALSATEVTTLYNSYNPSLNAGSLQKNLAGYWSLSKSDTTTSDSQPLVDDFSTDTTGGYSNIRTTKTYESSDFMRLTSDDATTSGFTKTLILVDGQTYQVKFKAKGTRLTTFKSIGNLDDLGTVIKNPTLTGDWQDYEFIITASQTSCRFYMEAGSIGEYFDVDDIEILDVTGMVQDLTPNSNAGVRIGTTWTTDRHGQSNKALSFNGTTDYVDLSSTDFISDFGSDTKGSISLWVKTAEAGTDVMFGLANDTSDTRYLMTYISSSKILFQIYSATSVLTLSSIDNLNDNSWHNVVITQDGTNVKMYIDGTHQETKASVEWLNTINGLNNLRIGDIEVLTASDRFWKGSLDDVRYYSGRALSQVEVTRLYNSYN